MTTTDQNKADIEWSIEGDNYFLECRRGTYIKRSGSTHSISGWLSLDSPLDIGSMVDVYEYMDHKVIGETYVERVERDGTKHRHSLFAVLDRFVWQSDRWQSQYSRTGVRRQVTERGLF